MAIETWIWLFPLVFMLHDFEELILFEPWLKKNAAFILQRVGGKMPRFARPQIESILHKTTPQFAVPISLIFLLTCTSSFLAAVYAVYPPFFLAAGLFFLHGFMHIGQALLLRRFVPSVGTSILLVIPYGALLLRALLRAGMINLAGMLAYCAAGAVLAVPFILGMHALGEVVYRVLQRRVMGE